MRTDWMPGKRNDILVMAMTWIETLNETRERWNVPAEELAELTALYNAAAAAYDRNNSETRGPVSAVNAKTAFQALAAFMRNVKKRRFLSPPLLRSDWARLGLQEPDGARTAHHDVTEKVEFQIHIRSIRQLRIEFQIQGASNRAKPKAYPGAAIVWRVGEEQPADINEFTRHATASRTPHTLRFSETERGKKVWISMAWQNSRGIVGHWAAYQNAIVP